MFTHVITCVHMWLHGKSCHVRRNVAAYPHVQHCYAWPACVAIPCQVQLRGNITLTHKFLLSKQLCLIELHVHMRSRLGLRELCSKFSSLFYSEFPLKSLHYLTLLFYAPNNYCSLV